MKKDINIQNTYVYQTYPDDKLQHPGLILIEEIWGVNDHLKEVADRFVKEGFNILVPELLPKGLLELLVPKFQEDIFDPEKRDEVQPKLRAAMQPLSQPEYAKETIVKLKACVDYLLADDQVNGEIAVLGFCFGGTYSFHLAAQDKLIKASVVFYGQGPSEEEMQNINCPVLAFYGDQDTNLIQALPKLKVDMEKHHKNFTSIVYPNVGHAFFNDTNVHMYNQEAANDAWEKTLGFLKKNLFK